MHEALYFALLYKSTGTQRTQQLVWCKRCKSKKVQRNELEKQEEVVKNNSEESIGLIGGISLHTLYLLGEKLKMDQRSSDIPLASYSVQVSVSSGLGSCTSLSGKATTLYLTFIYTFFKFSASPFQ